MTGLLTDLYQLTMAAGYFESGKADEVATFELFFRHLPRYRFSISTQMPPVKKRPSGHSKSFSVQGFR